MMMPLPALSLLLLSAGWIGLGDASPLARIHVKFVQPPHVQEHGITTDGGRILAQESYLSIGRRSARPQPVYGPPGNIGYYPRALPQARYASSIVNFAPAEDNSINYGDREYNHPTPDFSNGLDYPDPLLLTGEAAALAVKYIYGRGELFFKDIPHYRAILRNQDERRDNGLNGNILSSIRPGSPWYRND